MIVILLVAGVFLLWLGIALRKISLRYSVLVTALGLMVLGLTVGAYFGYL